MWARIHNKFATENIMPFVEMALHRDIPEDMRDEIDKDYQGLVPSYFADAPGKRANASSNASAPNRCERTRCS
jgi:hypothetical protein